MRSIEAMSISELELERKYVESKLSTNPAAEAYLGAILKEIKKRRKEERI